jgi:hypothetical protein
MRRSLLFAVCLSFAVGAADLSVAAVAPNGRLTETTSETKVMHDLGLVQPRGNSSDPAPAPLSAATVSTAEPVPELPTWAMMLLCLMGLGLAGFKKGRKDRLSPGIE